MTLELMAAAVFSNDADVMSAWSSYCAAGEFADRWEAGRHTAADKARRTRAMALARIDVVIAVRTADLVQKFNKIEAEKFGK